MARTNRKVKKKQRPSFGLPTGLILMAGRGGVGIDGWRTGVVTGNGTLCGGLGDVPPDVPPEEAQRAAAAMVQGLARDYHGQEVVVVWDPPSKPGRWTAAVVPAAAEPEPEPEPESFGPAPHQ
ncbi:hypothetical protein [Streptomyces sp. NBC_00347]|uniref:hypothetical protein n=1 Tax=Streptomyces sp. NBC_00347 TaxID=2975721 RepID=UPI00225707AB|nr:hypothetical protein [Streptomyces sp. NBC_00347]MCX5130159.1 hypothetical protein [Streptomyces sp. NBC_00347]